MRNSDARSEAPQTCVVNAASECGGQPALDDGPNRRVRANHANGGVQEGANNMPARLNQIIRETIHLPRRLVYAFLWAALPPEDRDNARSAPVVPAS
jgi:hypothetical protein